MRERGHLAPVRALFALIRYISEGTAPYPYTAQETARLDRDYMHLICDGA